tara:strand:- start:883 stop:1419 length:537 start_codon:yes stop_codon:yes gene_type:complete
MKSDIDGLEIDHNHTNRGKWSETGVPHLGWICVGEDDLGEPSQLCEMCESTEIRYVHFMQHSEYPEVLGVGCVCAENMENDYINPRIRETRLRSKARRRRTWSSRIWKPSKAGNTYLNTEGFNLTLIAGDRGGLEFWVIRVLHRKSGKKLFGKKEYQSLDMAKEGALVALIWSKGKLL